MKLQLFWNDTSHYERNWSYESGKLKTVFADARETILVSAGESDLFTSFCEKGNED